MLYLYLIIFAQTVLESLPISSSGHVILITVLCQKYLPQFFYFPPIPAPIFESWFYCLHGITALVLAFFFFRHWWFLLKNYKRLWRMIVRLILLVGIADLVTFVCYLAVRHFELGIPLWIGFLITGITLASLKFTNTVRPELIDGHSVRSFKSHDALLLGAVQGIALFSGISRFATTFVVARWLGYSNKRAFELTWMIQWPLIVGACVLGHYRLYEFGALGDFYSIGFVCAYLLAGVGAYYALRVVEWCVVRDKLRWFAYYMIVPTIIALFFF